MSEHTESLKRVFSEVADLEKEQCKNCKGLEQCKTGFRGHYQIVTYPYGDGTPCLQPVRCEYENARRAIAKMHTALKSSGIGRRFLNRTFETFNANINRNAYEQALNYANDFNPDTTDGLIFMGYVGVGKTHLAAAILHEIIKRGVQPIFVVATDLALKLSTSWQEGDTRPYAMKIQSAEVLFIDDLGKEADKETIRNFLFEIINCRYEDCKPTVITTNLNKDEIKKRYGEAIYSRLTEMSRTVIMTGADYRATNAARA